MGRIVVVNPHARCELIPKFPDTAEIDLLEAMLRFDPLERISIEEAITHSYFMDRASPRDEALTQPFVPFEGDISVDECRAKIWDEMCKFHPEMS